VAGLGDHLPAVQLRQPALGAVFRQLSVRQAIQHTVDQRAIADVIWRGTAAPGYGPVPQIDDDRYLSPLQRANPYPFDLAAAAALLDGHGWRPGADGIRACAAPGTGPADCGEGVAAGTRLAITVLAESGSDETDATMAELKSELSKAGIELTIDSQPLNTVLANSSGCTRRGPSAGPAAGPDCGWQLSYFGTQGSCTSTPTQRGGPVRQRRQRQLRRLQLRAGGRADHRQHDVPQRGRDAGLQHPADGTAAGDLATQSAVPGLRDRLRAARRGPGPPRRPTATALVLDEVSR